MADCSAFWASRMQTFAVRFTTIWNKLLRDLRSIGTALAIRVCVRQEARHSDRRWLKARRTNGLTYLLTSWSCICSVRFAKSAHVYVLACYTALIVAQSRELARPSLRSLVLVLLHVYVIFTLRKSAHPCFAGLAFSALPSNIIE